MAFIAKNNLLEHFKPRLRRCMDWASPCGWGFPDTMLIFIISISQMRIDKEQHFEEHNYRII